jgi:hypothetical protein
MKVHLMGMFDVDAKSKLLEHSPLSLDDVVLQLDIGAVQNHRSDGSVKVNHR